MNDPVENYLIMAKLRRNLPGLLLDWNSYKKAVSSTLGPSPALILSPLQKKLRGLVLINGTNFLIQHSPLKVGIYDEGWEYVKEIRDVRPKAQQLNDFKPIHSLLRKTDIEWKSVRGGISTSDPNLCFLVYQFLYGELPPQDKLVEIYNRANADYHTGEQESLLSDKQFDALKELLLANYPGAIKAKAVGAKGAGDKVKLPHEMGSLEKIKPTGGTSLAKWAKLAGSSIIVRTYKIDGISLELIYDGGKLKSAFTRGDGTVGKDITHHARKIKSVPNTIKEKEYLAVRAEAVMPRSLFDRKYSREKVGEKGFANPRNMMAGILNRKEALTDELGTDIHVLAFSIMNKETMGKVAMMEELHWNGFKTVEWEKLTAKLLAQSAGKYEESFVAMIARYKKTGDYEIDGLVLDIDDANTRSKLGLETNSLNPKFARAFKADDSNQEQTVVREVFWKVSKDGYIKPTLIVDPVMLSGASVSRATAFNAAYLRDNKIDVGAEVILTRSGDVIPYIVSVVKPAKRGALPDPSAVGNYAWNDTNIDLVLTDEDNDEVNIRRLIHFFSTAKVEDFSEGLIRRFYEHGYTSINAILAAKAENFLELPGIKEKSAQKIYDNIHARLNGIPLPRLMAASGSFGRALGEGKLTALFEEFGDEVINFTGMKVADVAASIARVHGFSLESGQQFAAGLNTFKAFMKKNGKYITIETKRVTSGKLSGKIFVFTGIRDNALQLAIENEGGKVGKSVTKDTTHLIAANPNDTSAKLEKARSQGIKIISIEQARKMVG